ncbi:MAG: tripartite tricarboxylate transporter substrate-binding protein [Candidatus Binatia bacterium]
MRARLLPVLVAALAVSAPAAAQPLTIVAPAAPGGGWDQTARALQQALSSVEPGVAVQVENVPGAAGTIGLARFVTAERGRTEALLVTGLVMVSGIVAQKSVVSLADVTPIARLTGEYEVIAVPAASPHRTLADLLAAFRAAPQTVSWGGGSAGGTDDLLARLVAETIAVPPTSVNYVAFSGGGEALAALLGGQITAGVSGLGEFAQSLESGQLRALAVSSPERLPGLDAPTLREAGVPLDLANWRAVVAPPGVSDAGADQLRQRVHRVVTSAPWRETLARTGWTDLYLDGAPFRQFLLAEQAQVEAVLRRLDAGRTTTAPAGWTPTASTAPRVALGALVTVLLLHLRRRPGPSTAEPLDPQGGGRRVAAITGAALAHAWLQPVVGFVPTATLLFSAGAYALTGRLRPRDVAIGLLLTAGVAVVFTRGLGVPLPLGPFGR